MFKAGSVFAFAVLLSVTGSSLALMKGLLHRLLLVQEKKLTLEPLMSHWPGT